MVYGSTVLASDGLQAYRHNRMVSSRVVPASIVLVISFLTDSVSVSVKKDYLGSSTVQASDEGIRSVDRSVGRYTRSIDIRIQHIYL